MLGTSDISDECEMVLTYAGIRNYSGEATQIFVFGRDINSNGTNRWWEFHF